MEDSRPLAQLYPVRSGQSRTVDKGQAVAADQANSSAAEDLQLLRRAGKGDGKSFHVLMDRHAGRLFGLAYSLLGNAADAEDVVQETFAGAFRGIDGFEGRSSVSTWLTRILVLQAAKWRRDQWKPTESLSGIEPQSSVAGAGRKDVPARKLASGSESGAAAVERRLDLQAALNKLSPEHRQVLVLREYEGHSYEEIAQMLGVPRGTVESRLHRARGELRNKLKDYL